MTTRREKDRPVPGGRRPVSRQVVLVGHLPQAVKVGVALTDGNDHYQVKELQDRNGERWVKLENASSPELEAWGWYRLEDIGELGFDKTPGPARRRYGTETHAR